MDGQGYDAAMRMARWRWVLVPMILVVAGCLPQPPPALPPSFLSEYNATGLPTFTVQPPPAGETAQDIVTAGVKSGFDSGRLLEAVSQLL